MGTVARTTPAKHPGQLEELREASRKEERGKMLHASKKLHELQAKAAPKVERSLRASYTDHLDHFEQEAAEQRRAEQAAVKATSKKIQQIQQRAAPRTEVVLSDSHAQAREEHAARAAKKRVAERKEMKAHRKMLDAIKAAQSKIVAAESQEAVAIQRAAIAIQSARRRSVAQHHIKLLQSGAIPQARLQAGKTGKRLQQRRNAITSNDAWHVAQYRSLGMLAAAA